MMDPALWEVLKIGDLPQEEIEAIVRLDRPEADVPGLRIVCRFGPIATCRLKKENILQVHEEESVVSLKAKRVFSPEREEAASSEPLPLSILEGDVHRSPGLAYTGQDVVIGIVDWCCDFHHPNFRNADGSTRLLALWDQRGHLVMGVTNNYGYGVIHTRDEINRALQSDDPYQVLGYHPGETDFAGVGMHGTHVMDIAAGNGSCGGPQGVAPNADLIFVHLANQDTGGLANLGDSVRILEAVDFIARLAGSRPWVINLSVGRHGGPHDGTSLCELAFDYLLSAAPNRFICQSTGNYYERSTHASGHLRSGEERTLSMVIDEEDYTPNELEIWYSGKDEFSIRMESPSGTLSPWVGLGEDVDLIENGILIGRIYNRAFDPNNADHHVDAFLYTSATHGVWRLTIRADIAIDGTFHAWLERDDACPKCQTRFIESDVDHFYTTGTLANSQIPLVVGAYNQHSGSREITNFSSAGPTRDNRIKPDLVAAGFQVLAARSAPRGWKSNPGLLVRKSGSSMATPEVTGAVALCLEAARRPLYSHEIRTLILDNVEPVTGDPQLSLRYGRGYLNISRAVQATERLTEMQLPLPERTTAMESLQSSPEWGEAMPNMVISEEGVTEAHSNPPAVFPIASVGFSEEPQSNDEISSITVPLREVIVGEKIELDVASVIPISTVKQVRWVLPGTVVKNYSGDRDKAQLSFITKTDLEKPKLVFYWVDAADGRRVRADVTCRFGFMEYTVNLTFLFDVKAPRLDHFKAKSSIPVIFFAKRMWRLSFGGDRSAPRGDIHNNPGIEWDWQVTMPLKHGGWIKDLQTVRGKRTKKQYLAPGSREFRELEWMHPEKARHEQLDQEADDRGTEATYSSNGSYPPVAFPEKVEAGKSYLLENSTYDTPSTELAPLDYQVSVEQFFYYYILYKPDKADAIWVPIARAEWFWSAEAEKQSGKWILKEKNGGIKTEGAATTEFPTYQSATHLNQWVGTHKLTEKSPEEQIQETAVPELWRAKSDLSYALDDRVSLGYNTGLVDPLDRVVMEPVLRGASEKNLLAHILRLQGAKFDAGEVDPDRLYRELVSDLKGGRAHRIATNFIVLARPGEVLHGPTQKGDILLRITPGYLGLGHVAVISNPTFLSEEELSQSSFESERKEPGYYAVVTEAGTNPHPSSQPFARRILNKLKQMLPFQILIRPKPSTEDPGPLAPNCLCSDQTSYSISKEREIFQQEQKNSVESTFTEAASHHELDVLEQWYGSQAGEVVQPDDFDDRRQSDTEESEVASVRFQWQQNKSRGTTFLGLLLNGEARMLDKPLAGRVRLVEVSGRGKRRAKTEKTDERLIATFHGMFHRDAKSHIQFELYGTDKVSLPHDGMISGFDPECILGVDALTITFLNREFIIPFPFFVDSLNEGMDLEIVAIAESINGQNIVELGRSAPLSLPIRQRHVVETTTKDEGVPQRYTDMLVGHQIFHHENYILHAATHSAGATPAHLTVQMHPISPDGSSGFSFEKYTDGNLQIILMNDLLDELVPATAELRRLVRAPKGVLSKITDDWVRRVLKGEISMRLNELFNDCGFTGISALWESDNAASSLVGAFTDRFARRTAGARSFWELRSHTRSLEVPFWTFFIVSDTVNVSVVGQAEALRMGHRIIRGSKVFFMPYPVPIGSGHKQIELPIRIDTSKLTNHITTDLEDVKRPNRSLTEFEIKRLTDLIAAQLANIIAHEIAHSLGLMHEIGVDEVGNYKEILGNSALSIMSSATEESSPASQAVFSDQAKIIWQLAFGVQPKFQSAPMRNKTWTGDEWRTVTWVERMQRLHRRYGLAELSTPAYQRTLQGKVPPFAEIPPKVQTGTYVP